MKKEGKKQLQKIGAGKFVASSQVENLRNV